MKALCLFATVVLVAGVLLIFRWSTDAATGLTSVTIGMTGEEIHERAGQPWRVLLDVNGPEPDAPGQLDPCWLYPKSDGNWRYFCFGADRRVQRIVDSVSLANALG